MSWMIPLSLCFPALMSLILPQQMNAPKRIGDGGGEGLPDTGTNRKEPWNMPDMYDLCFLNTMRHILTFL